MDSAVKHPWTLALFRAVLALATALVVVALAGVGLWLLGVVAVVAGLSLLLTGDVNAVGLALLAAVMLLATGGVAGVALVGSRRLDRRLIASRRRPTPLETLKAQYVAGDLDEVAFERRVERLLLGEPAPGTSRLGRVRRLLGLLSHRLVGVAGTRLRRRVGSRRPPRPTGTPGAARVVETRSARATGPACTDPDLDRHHEYER